MFLETLKHKTIAMCQILSRRLSVLSFNTEGKTEAQRCSISCPKTHSNAAVKLGFEMFRNTYFEYPISHSSDFDIVRN